MWTIFHSKRFSISKIEKEFREPNSSKVTTFCNITSKILKQNSKNFSDTFQKFFNDALTGDNVPDKLKCAHITPLF